MRKWEDLVSRQKKEKKERREFRVCLPFKPSTTPRRTKKLNQKPEQKNSLFLPLFLQTLIYAGQILEDDRTLASYGVPRVR